MCGNMFGYFHHVQTHLLCAHSDNNDVVKLIGRKKINALSQEGQRADAIEQECESEKNNIGKYFTMLNNFESMCTLCDKVFFTQELSVLQAHLLQVHSENLEVTFDMNLRKNKSIIYKYARRVNDIHVEYDLCGKLCLSKNGSTKSTREHLKNMHRDNYAVMKDLEEKKQNEESDEDSLSPNNLYVPRITNKKSPAWKFFQKVDAINSKCLFCNKMLGTKGGTTKTLIIHLKKRHFDIENVIDLIERRIIEIKTEKEKKSKHEVDQSTKTEENITISI